MVPSAEPGHFQPLDLGCLTGGKTSKAGGRLPDGRGTATGPGRYALLTPAALKAADVPLTTTLPRDPGTCEILGR